MLIRLLVACGGRGDDTPGGSVSTPENEAEGYTPGGLVRIDGPFDAGDRDVTEGSVLLLGRGSFGSDLHTMGDLDADGRPELATGGYVVPGDVLDGTTSSYSWLVSVPAIMVGPAGDVDNDGVTDVAATLGRSSTVHLGPLVDEPPAAGTVTTPDFGLMVPWFDADGDGAADLLLPADDALWVVPSSTVVGWDGPPDPAWRSYPLVADSSDVRVVVVADVDGGGAPEVLVEVAAPIARLEVLSGEALARPDAAPSDVLAHALAGTILVAPFDDWDGDATPDVVWFQQRSKDLCWLPTAWGIWSGADLLASAPLTPLGYASAVEVPDPVDPDACAAPVVLPPQVADLDEDGAFDLVLPGGDPSWVLAPDLAAGGPVRRLRAVSSLADCDPPNYDLDSSYVVPWHGPAGPSLVIGAPVLSTWDLGCSAD
jgi:hypothetical protein